jgi:hypothetical protein
MDEERHVIFVRGRNDVRKFRAGLSESSRAGEIGGAGVIGRHQFMEIGFVLVFRVVERKTLSSTKNQPGKIEIFEKECAAGLNIARTMP